MEDDFYPSADPAGDFSPQPPNSPTAMVSSPDPAPGEQPIAVRAWRRRPQSLSGLGGIVNGVFNVLDAVGDTIAETIGLRD